jgi:hypothetical protein
MRASENLLKFINNPRNFLRVDLKVLGIPDGRIRVRESAQALPRQERGES